MNYFFNFEKLAYVQGNRPRGCILCSIRDHDPEVQSLTIYEGELFFVTLNLYPYNPGHLLVFPRRHLEDIREYSQEEETRMSKLTKQLVALLEKTHNAQGFNIGYNMGLVSGASIKHLHLHIIPRYPKEIGISDLLAGKRVLVQNPKETKQILINEFKNSTLGDF